MRILHKNLISTVLLIFTISSMFIAGYSYIEKNRIELYIDQLFYEDFNDLFLRNNETIIKRFDEIYQTNHVSVNTLAQIAQESQEQR